MAQKTKVHEVQSVQFDDHSLYLRVDGQLYRIHWEACSERLRQATFEERRFVRVSPSGYGIHWPLLDEDLAIDPLLQQAEPLDRLPDALSGGEMLVGMN